MRRYLVATYGEERVKQIVDKLDFPFLALNIRDTEWQEPVFEPYKIFDKGGVKVAVLGEAFAYTPVANPRWMIPKWSFGIREDDVRANVAKARKEGAQLVVLLSHNGFDTDRKMASRVEGIDVILTAHTHDALPEVVKVGKTLLVVQALDGDGDRLLMADREGRLYDGDQLLYVVAADYRARGVLRGALRWRLFGIALLIGAQGAILTVRSMGG